MKQPSLNCLVLVFLLKVAIHDVKMTSVVQAVSMYYCSRDFVLPD